MILKTLVENTSISSQYGHKHGVCFYIETSKHKILFDLGPNELFLQNAKKMNVEISDIDTVIISHGHKDHGGAIKKFLEVNKKAKIYVRENAFEKHYTKFLPFYINVGLDESLKVHPQVVLTKDRTIIDEELMLFSNVPNEKLCPVANKKLFKKTDGKIQLDDFAHEQNLIISEEGKKILLAGCAHSGIVNIMNSAQRIVEGELHCCIGGFHLYNPVSKKQESDVLINEIANELKKSSTEYYTCHCTGEHAFTLLQQVLSGRIKYLSSGSVLEI